jgi:hypothetical protein
VPAVESAGVPVSDVVRKWKYFGSIGRTSMQVDMCSFTRVHGLAGVSSRSSVFESEHSCYT